jgi:hypothetical protein
LAGSQPPGSSRTPPTLVAMCAWPPYGKSASRRLPVDAHRRSRIVRHLLFPTYYLQQTLGYSPLVTGIAFLPISAGSVVADNLATIVLMPRFGPKPLVGFGMLAAAGAMVWLAQLRTGSRPASSRSSRAP